MSDFFSHLLQRHLGESPRIEPRRRARFEPEPLAAVAPPMPTPPDDSPGEDASWTGPAMDAPQPVAPAPRRFAPSIAAPAFQPLPQERRAAPGTVAPAKEAFDSRPLREQGRPRGPAQPPSQPKLLNEVIAESLLEPTGTASSTTLLIARPVPRQAPPLAAAPSQVSSTAMPAEIRREDEGQPRGIPHQEEDNRIRRLAEASTPLTQTDQSLGAPTVLLPKVDPSLFIASKRPDATEAPAAPAAEQLRREGLLVPPAWLAQLQAQIQRQCALQQAQEQPEPVINVTIGRVEVRAQTSPALPQPKSKVKRPTVMSLDDYLSQRKGRGSS